MAYKAYEIEEERLREAIHRMDVDKVQYLLNSKTFRMLGEEMDELLKLLGDESLQTLQKKMQEKMRKETKEKIGILSKEAQLKHAVESNDLALIRQVLGKQNDCSQCHLRASSIASISIHAMRETLTPDSPAIELLLQCACNVQPEMWDSAVALPILYAVLSELPAALRKKLLQLPVARSRSVPVALLHLAVKSGNMSVVEEIISDPDLYIGVDDMYEGDSNRATALLRASHYGLPKMVAYLIRCGADMRKRDRSGRTALHLASAQGHDNVVRLLLQEICNPVGFALRRRHETHQNEEEAEEEMVQQLTVASGVEEITSIDAVDEWGMSALHLGVCGGHAEVVTSLLDGGADPSLRAPHKSKFTAFLETYLSVSRKEVIDYEKLYTTRSEASTGGDDHGRLLRNDCLRFSPVMSTYWQPGGFTALHFAIAYARNDKYTVVLRSLLRTPLAEHVRCMRDSNGLTALNWAVGMLNSLEKDGSRELKHEKRMRSKMVCMLQKGGGGGGADDVEGWMMWKVRRMKQVLESMEEKKKEMEWGEMMVWALRKGEFVVAEEMAKEKRRWIKKPLSHGTMKHLRWAAEEPLWVIQEQWRLRNEAREFVAVTKGWERKVEKVLMEMSTTMSSAGTEAAVMVMEKADLQELLLWALRRGMADLAIALCSRRECELVEPLRGGGGWWRWPPLAPLQAATFWQHLVSDIKPVVIAMEARPDVRERVLQKRAIYVRNFNSLMVASVLIGGLAFSAILQPPSSVKNTLGHWPPPPSATATYDNSRWWTTPSHGPQTTASHTTTTTTTSTDQDSGPANRFIARCFIWSTLISFFLSMYATITGIVGPMTPATGELIYSDRLIKNFVVQATLSVAGAVLAISVSFAVVILDAVRTG